MGLEGADGINYEILTRRFVAGGQWDRSLASALEWLGHEPEQLQAHRVAAQSLVNLNRDAEAKPHIERVLAGNPRDDFAHRLMSTVQFELGQFKAADESIRQAIQLNPRDAYHWHHLARMSYQQGDLVAAGKCAEKALELNPRDAEILNLQILCVPDGPNSAVTKIRRYEEALALDPESANIYNNIGVEYLHQLKDYAKAEEFFRRALFFDPSSKLLRRNLFTTLKHRDPVYRILCAPKSFFGAFFSGGQNLSKKSKLLYFLSIPIWLLLFRFAIGGMILWFMWVWPLTKVYEFLTIGDIRARAGEMGARRGGWFNYRQWPLLVRLSLFGLFLVCFWGGIYLAFRNEPGSPRSPVGTAILGVIMCVALLTFFGYQLRSILRSHIKTTAARRRAKQINAILEPKNSSRKWWQFFRRNT